MITPAEFLELLNDKEKSDFKIGTIDPNYSGGKAKIKFDGEDTVSGKEYLSVGYSPKANDRVLLVKISGTYLILGEIGSAGGGGGGETITASDVSLLSNNFIANNVEGGMDELFTNVSNGKGLIATAITDKGGSATGSDTFGQLAEAIEAISSGKKWASGSTLAAGRTLSVRGLPFKPGVFFCKRTGADSSSDGNRARSSIYVKKEVVGMSFDIIIGFGTATSLFLPNVATYEDGIDISVSLTGNYNWIAFE